MQATWDGSDRQHRQGKKQRRTRWESLDGMQRVDSSQVLRWGLGRSLIAVSNTLWCEQPSLGTTSSVQSRKASCFVDNCSFYMLIG